MFRLFALLMPFYSIQLNAQITPSTTNFSFGDIYAESQTYTDITFKNTSEKMQFLLTVDKPQDVYYIFSAKRVLPDSSVTIRLKINERRKGKFNYAVDVFFSEPKNPISVRLSGTVKESNGNSMTACPDFNSTPPTHLNTFDMVIRVIDSVSREPIKNASVYLVENGELIGDYQTDQKGVVKKRMTLGYFYITAEKLPYRSNFHEGYLNSNRNYVEIELSNGAMSQPPVETPLVQNPPEIVDTIEIVINDHLPPPTSDTVEIEQPMDEVEEPVVEVVEVDKPIVEVLERPLDPKTLEEVPDTVFNEGYFKHNNITFILDVSTSMNGMGKMALLKMSMIELTQILRRNDMVSMVKYSSEVETILKGSNGDQKQEIIATVKGLRTSGLTAGGNAIKQAYKLNRKTYIPNGNNIVIMITDGVFNKGDKDYLKTIKNNYASRGIRFSVVGIKTSDFITAHMQNIVVEGGGDFVRILTIENAQTKLINEIRRTSFKF